MSAAFIPQAAAIPVYFGRICLVNSSSCRGWVIPKGRIEPFQSVRQTALQEAWEEAGLRGFVDEAPIGAFHYKKNGSDYRATVFIMQVTRVESTWPEDHRRMRRWVLPSDANQFIQVAGMRRVIGRIAALLECPTRTRGNLLQTVST